METLFDSAFFAGNRERLRTLFPGTAPIIITANGVLQRNSDVTYAFRQDSNFWYLTGIDKPDIILVLDKDNEYIIVPEREKVIEMFDGAIDDKELTKRSGIKKIYPETEGWKKLSSRLKKVKHVATLAAAPTYVEPHGFYTNPARSVLIQRFKDIKPDVDILDLRMHLMKMRMIKQESEIMAIQKAIDITIASIKETTTPAKLVKFAYEYELEAAVDHGFRRRGAKGLAFDSVVASGPNSCTIHSHADYDELSKNSFVIVDVGAQVENYAADIARTYPVGKITKRHKQVYGAVLEAQEYAISQLQIGVTLRECEKLSEHYVGEKLRELGLIKAIEHDTVRQFFPHATSHYLGLDAHDTGDYDEPLTQGMVVTVEPGIYIPDEGIGVRIEDDILITANGPVNLSAALPRNLV